MTGIDVIAGFSIAVIFSYAATPFMARLAARLGLMDHPAKKKVHAHPTPLLGGVAIYFAFITAISFSARAAEPFMGVLVGGTFIMIVGIADDKFNMMPRVKLLGQIIAALIAIKMGLHVVFVKNPYISIPFTLLWLVGITNAFNLLDNINGLSSGVAAISAFFFGVIAFIHGDIALSVISFALMGACLGFLKYNFRGKIFMGDSGSMFLGFMLASIAVAGSWKTSGVTTSVAIPVIILGYPIFDMAFVVITRLLKGDPISKGGKDHSSHRFGQAAMEAIRGLRNRKHRPFRGFKNLALTIWALIKGLKKKGEDRAANRLANLGFKKKWTVFALCGISFCLGSAALFMTVLGQYFDVAIMVIAAALMTFFGIRLAMVKIDDKSMNGIDNLIILSLGALIIGLPFSNSITEIAASTAIALWLFKKIFVIRSLKIVNTPLNTPISLYFIFVALSLINSRFFMTSLAGFGFKGMEHLLLFIVIIETVRTRSDFRKLISAVLLSCALIGIDGLWQYATGYDFLRGYPVFSLGRMTASFKFPNSLASWLIAVIPLCVSLAIFSIKEKSYKILSVFLTILLPVCLFLTFNRSSLIAVLIAIAFLFWKRGNIAKKALLLLLIMMFLGLGFIALSGGNIGLFRGGEGAIFHRITLAKMSWQMFMDRPFLGHGINTFMSLFGDYVRPDAYVIPEVSYAHNCYLQIAVETGIFSLLAFLWMIAALFTSSLKGLSTKKEGFIKASQLGLLAGLLAYLMHSALDTNLYALPLAILFYYMLGLTVSAQKLEK